MRVKQVQTGLKQVQVGDIGTATAKMEHFKHLPIWIANLVGKPENPRPSEGCRDVEMQGAKSNFNPPGQEVNQPNDSPSADIKRKEAKDSENKDEPNEEDKAVAGFTPTFAATQFTASLALLLMFQPEADQRQPGSPSFYLHATSLAFVCLAMFSAISLLFYILRYPEPYRPATGMKKLMMYIGCSFLLPAFFSRFFIALPPSYLKTVALEFGCGAIVAVILIICHVQGWFNKILTTPLQEIRIIPGSYGSISTQPIITPDTIRPVLEVMERFKGLVNEIKPAMEAIQLLNEVLGSERSSDNGSFPASHLRDSHKRDLLMAPDDSSSEHKISDNRSREASVEPPTNMLEDPFSISKCIGALQKFEGKVSTVEMMKAIKLVRSDPSMQEMFVAMNEKMQEYWISTEFKA